MKPAIITIGNNKGGVGKSTTCVNLAAGLALQGKHVLVIDADPQANTTSALIPDPALREELGLVRALEAPTGDSTGTFTANACRTRTPGLDLTPNSILCMEWEAKSHNSLDSVFGFKRLVDQDDKLARYDYVLIDTPPNIGPMLRNALLISTHVLAPCPVGDQFALDGLGTFLKVLEQARQHNTGLRILGAVLTKYDRRVSTHRTNRDTIRQFFADNGLPVLQTEIRVNVDLDRAHTHRKTIFSFAPSKAGAKDYMQLAQEVLRLVQV